MDLKHSNIILIEQYLETTGSTISYEIEFLYKMYKELFKDEIKSHTNRSKVHNAFNGLQYLAMDLLAIQYKLNGNSIKSIRPGFVYAITNPAWPDCIKIGSAIDVYDRLNSYQTSSPNRDYKLETYVFVDDRLSYEKQLHEKYNAEGEWIRTNVVPVEFKQMFDARRDKLSEIIKQEVVSKIVQNVEPESNNSIRSILEKYL
jgi:hypothetical protein